MKTQADYFNQRLEQQWARGRRFEKAEQITPPGSGNKKDEIEELITVARYVRTHPALQADPEFAQRLEMRVRAHASAIQHKRTAAPWWRLHALRPWSMQLALAAVVLFCLVLGTGVAMAAQGATPNTPLYAVKSWVQQMQITFTASPKDQAELRLQIARDHLSSLKTVVTTLQEDAYTRELTTLEQQLTTTSQSIHAVPAGKDHDRLSQEFAALQRDTRQTLHTLLPSLKMSEQVATTAALQQLGEQVTHLQAVTIIVSLPPHAQVTLLLTGEHFQPGAQLWLNNQRISVIGTLQHGTYVFFVDWNSRQPIKTVSLLNPDATVVQTTAITVSTASSSGQNGNTNGQGTGKNGSDTTGNGDNTHPHGPGDTNTGGGKPSVTPTPHH
ncbi:DUF5667 domain-containing protein [Ktedonobacter racemifer]|uniref:DUF5667 domain-containing protein n=1 Tax=Ktedonobacter racemifer DSM 44963 TaxID=485913 RepID=D6TH27_KTERA|nr:DUF5667 domain-containing protein [Ktedonobacter racemifer]EFH90769.1 hypothetical protein Krac_12404 [Ktedonobacter racemifer DSM 44963]